MTMRRPIAIAAVFSACLGVVLATMGYLSATALRLDRSESEAQRRAVIEENVRLALWRMDSLLAPVIAAESALPPTAFVVVRQPDSQQAAPQQAPPPTALPVKSPFVQAYFQIDSSGRTTLLPGGSPVVPDIVSQVNTAHTDVQEALRELAQVDQARRLLADARVASLDGGRPPALAWDSIASWGAPAEDLPIAVPSKASTDEPLSAKGQVARNSTEYEYRSRIVQGNRQAQNTFNALNGPGQAADIAEMMTPLWIGDALVLLREANLGGAATLQGCVLDWPAISSALLKSIGDLFPHARLEAVRAGKADADESRRLASLPVRLVLGTTPVPSASGLSPVEISLMAAWACALAAAAAVAALLYGVVSLSERRAAFVSAVTHELRTPLTTFRLYSEMLNEGMVPDESRRREYLQTLHREADRLWHLVENVLAYARLERGRGGRIEGSRAADLFERMRTRLASRAADAGLSLDAAIDDAARDAIVLADAGATEQILFNLVDNACKYASGAADKALHVRLDVQDRWVVFEVADHGPGIEPRTARRLFRPFSKSAEDAAHSAPGVGLGLALCRRLARQMRGQLVVAPFDGAGARVTLRLPMA